MRRSLHFDKLGQPIGTMEWARLFEDLAYRIVNRTEIRGLITISTIWLGLNHGYSGRPLIFETMVMPFGDHCERYATLEEALAGHEEMVRKHGFKRLPRKQKKRFKKALRTRDARHRRTVADFRSGKIQAEMERWAAQREFSRALPKPGEVLQ